MVKKEITGGKLHIVTTKNLTAMWGKKDFCIYDDNFVRARKNMQDKLNRCFCCDRLFQVNKEKVSLVNFNCRVGNKCVCNDCFEKLEFKK